MSELFIYCLNLFTTLLLFKELVSRFNFHHYDNLMHTRQKMDPRKRQLELTGQEVVSLLFCAYSGDVSALSRFQFHFVKIYLFKHCNLIDC